MLSHENAVLPDCCYRVSVKLLIQNDEGKYLLSQHKDWNWIMLWGGLDFWEDIEVAARREAKEEAWLDLLDFDLQPKLFFTVKPPHKDFHVAQVCYSATVWDISKFSPSEECIALQYFNIEENETYCRTWESMRKIYEDEA